MNIEELAKTENFKIPSKKKGYDDVEISELSDDDDKKSVKMAKKFRMSQLIKRNKAGSKDKTKELKSTSRSEESLPQLKTEPVKSYEEKEKEKEKLREGAAEVKPVNVVTVPRYTAPPALKAGADEKQKKGCCVVS